VVTVCIALIAVAFAGYGSSKRESDERAAVPAEAFEPFGWQATVHKSPPGPATLLLSGEGWGLRGVTFKGKVAVLSESGVYRMQRYTTDVEAGEDVLLSPDGQLIADSAYEKPADSAGPPIWFTDLTSGKSVKMTMPGSGRARPVAWSPDGRKLLIQVAVAPAEGPWPGGKLELLDLTTGDVKVLADLGSAPVHRAQLAAFAPTGRRVAVQVGNALQVIDLTTGARKTLTTLTAGRRLAGVGAWSSDGTQVAVLTMSGCVQSCDQQQLDVRSWAVSELDTTTGLSTIGEYPALKGLTARVLGRMPDGQLAVVRYRAYDKLRTDATGALSVNGTAVDETDYKAVGGATLLGLQAGGGQHALVKLPSGVSHVDVAADLVKEGRFDGRSPRPMPLPAPFWAWTLLAVLLILLYSLYRRIRRRGKS
jgi:hypothetical protein